MPMQVDIKQPDADIKTDVYPGMSEQLVERLFKHSETLLKDRKDLKAPDSYPKKSDIATKFKNIKQAMGVLEAFNYKTVIQADIDHQCHRFMVIGDADGQG